MTLTEPSQVDDADGPTGQREQREATELVEALRAGRPARRWPVALAGAVVGAGLVVALPAIAGSDDQEASNSGAVVGLSTVAAESTDIVSTIDYDGTLGFGEPMAIAAPVDGTLTMVAQPGSTLQRGEVIAEVDGEPIFLWYGDVPAWRDLSASSEAGTDIVQVEQNLAAIGFDSFADTPLTVDDEWTANTTAAVELWQETYDMEVTGEIPRGTVVFLDGPVTVTATTPEGSTVRAGSAIAQLTAQATSHTAFTEADGIIDEVVEVGTTLTDDTVLYTIAGRDVVVPPDLVGTTVVAHHTGEDVSVDEARPVLTSEATAQRVTVDVPADSVTDFSVGLAVDIELADGREVPGRVDDIAGTATVPGAAQAQAQGQVPDPVVEVTILVESDDDLLEGPVTVRLIDERITGATVVPVRSLVALAEGGHAVEVVDGSGTTRLVAVELGAFDDGMVEVTNGAVSPGDQVVVPV